MSGSLSKAPGSAGGFVTDVFNCGACGTVCPASRPVCRDGACVTADCTGSCASATCCGAECCTSEQRCCFIPGATGQLSCVDAADGGTCPIGCPSCQCLSAGTLIATALGERAIEDLRYGDLVYSIDRGAIALVPIVQLTRVAVAHHRMVRVHFDHGLTIEASGSHPLADGRPFESLAAGMTLADARVWSVEELEYDGPFTYDVLPGSDTGIYFVGGVPLGSTLHGRPQRAASQR